MFMFIKHAEYSCKVRHILVLTDKPTCLFLGLLLGAPFLFLLLTFPFSGIPIVIVVDWWKVGETKHEISWLFLVLYSKFGVKCDKIKKVTNPSLPLFSGSTKENIGYCQHSWTFQHCYEINWQESHTGILFWISLWVKHNIPHSGDWLV